MARIALLGGTGPEGLGLALRFALAGHDIIIGSREPHKAADGARTLADRLGASSRQVAGLENERAAAAAEVVALTLPFAGIDPLLTRIGASLAGKIVIDVVNPLTFSNGLFRLIPVLAGSAAEDIQQRVPAARVVSGFKNLSAKELWNADQPLHGDALLCTDDAGARQFAVDLIARMPQLRAVDAGSLTNARHLESITALLLNLNRRYRALTSIEILGLTLPA